MLIKAWNAVKKVLEQVSKVISSIINFILLSLVYFIAIGGVSLTAKLFDKHFLELKKQNRKSNWQKHKVTKEQIEKYYRTF